MGWEEALLRAVIRRRNFRLYRLAKKSLTNQNFFVDTSICILYTYKQQ